MTTVFWRTLAEPGFSSWLHEGYHFTTNKYFYINDGLKYTNFSALFYTNDFFIPFPPIALFISFVILSWLVSVFLWPTCLQGQGAELCDTPSPSGPPSGHHLGSLRVPPSGLSLHFLAVISRTPPSPKVPPLHTTGAANMKY